MCGRHRNLIPSLCTNGQLTDFLNFSKSNLFVQVFQVFWGFDRDTNRSLAVPGALIKSVGQPSREWKNGLVVGGGSQNPLKQIRRRIRILFRPIPSSSSSSVSSVWIGVASLLLECLVLFGDSSCWNRHDREIIRIHSFFALFYFLFVSYLYSFLFCWAFTPHRRRRSSIFCCWQVNRVANAVTQVGSSVNTYETGKRIPSAMPLERRQTPWDQYHLIISCVYPRGPRGVIWPSSKEFIFKNR